MNFVVLFEERNCMKTHRDLDVWKNAIDLATDIYRVTNAFYNDELAGIISQFKQAASAVPSKIAEGAARKQKMEFIQFLYDARFSLSELETLIVISLNLGYIEQLTHDALIEKATAVRKQLNGLINHMNISQ